MDLSKTDFEELAEFRYRLRKFLRFSEMAAKSAGITPRQHQLLLAVQGFPDRDYATPTEIAERLQLRHNSCLGLVTRCELLGLVERFVNENDRRSVYIRLTQEGLRVLNDLTVRHQAELYRLGVSHRNFIFKDMSEIPAPTKDSYKQIGGECKDADRYSISGCTTRDKRDPAAHGPDCRP